MTNHRLGRGISRHKTGVSYVLLAGVSISLLLEIVGIIIFYHSHGHLAILQNTGVFIQGRGFFSFIYEQFQGKHVEGIAVLFMTAGIIVLILTPYVRVIVSAIYFACEKNMKHALMSLFIFVFITLSFALH